MKAQRRPNLSTKRPASRFYRIKTGHCLTGQYVPALDGEPAYRSVPGGGDNRTQTREHSFNECPEMLEETGRGKSRRKIRDLLADGRCSQAVLDSLSTADAGRLVPAEEDAGSEVSEWEPRDRREREDERSAEAEELDAAAGRLGAGEELPLFPPIHALLHGVRVRGSVGAGHGFVCSFFLLFGFFSFVSLVRAISSRDGPGQRAKGSLQRAATARTADRKRTEHTPAMIYLGRMRVMVKQRGGGKRTGALYYTSVPAKVRTLGMPFQQPCLVSFLCMNPPGHWTV